MEKQKIMPVLFAVLSAAALFLGVCFAVMYRNTNYLPGESLDDMYSILASDNIYIDRGSVPLRKERRTIYVCESEGYNENVALQLGGSSIKYKFATPDGEIIILYSGTKIEFKSGFEFHYSLDENNVYNYNIESMSRADQKSADRASKIVTEFLDGGSRSFDEKGKLNIITEISGVYESGGVVYVECVRTIDGLEITGNRVICAVDDGVVADAYGKWCFLTLGKSYSSQVTDVLNILFNVKKEIDSMRELDGVSSSAEASAVVSGINRCYTLYYLGDDGFCFIPCWQIVTDIYGEFIYNAVDGTLYTKN